MNKSLAHFPNFFVWLLNVVPFNLKIVLLYEIILSSKVTHKHIGQNGSLLINKAASEITLFAF